MSFIIRNLTASAVILDDLGITLPASVDLDITDLQPQDVAISVDLPNAITGLQIAVLDPVEGTQLDAATSNAVVAAHNDSHWGIRGGVLDQLDDVDMTGAADTYVLQQNGSGTYVPVAPSTIAGDMILDDLGDVNNSSGNASGVAYILEGDGTDLNVTPLTGSGDFVEAIEDIVGAMGVDGTDTTFVYTDAGSPAGTIQWNVDDVFLRNTGDTLDSGTLTIASGASVDIATGADLTIQDAPTNATDATNKEYVDSVAAGLDPKESVRVATILDVGGIYAAGGGTGGSGAFTGADAEPDGVTLVVGDRVLVKDQSDPLQNGIYEVTAVNGGSPNTVDMERSSDQDGTPANEVSAGNFTFVEQGTQQDTGWVVQGDGILTLNTDPINWVQFSSAGTVDAGIGLAKDGTTIDLDVDNLTVAAVVSTDTLAFHDGDGTPGASGTQTRKVSFADMLTDLDVVAGVAGTGLIVQTGPDTYVTRSVAVDGAGALDGLAITNGSGVSGNPTVGLDINGLPVRSDVVDLTDRVAVYNITSSANEYYTVAELAGAATASNSFETWLAAGNTSGDISIVADSSADTATLTGGVGISIGFTAASDTITYTFGNYGMADTPIVGADTIPFFDASNSNEPEYRSLTNVVSDLGLATAAWTTITGDTGTGSADGPADTLTLVGATSGGITTVASDDPESVTFGITGVDLATFGGTVALTDFAIINDSTDTAATLSTKVTWANIISGLNITTGGVESITASTNEEELGAVISGTATDPIVGVTIETLIDPDDDMDATDEFIVHDKSEGAGSPAGANRKMTGQNIADGVLNILNFPSGLAITDINGQQVLTLIDTTRANKVLSIESSTVTWSENRIGNNDWVQVGNANDALSGYIVPMDATIVKASIHTANNNGNTKGVDLYIDGVNDPGNPILSVTGAAGEKEDSDITLNIDVTADQKIRIRGDAAGGTIEDTVVTLWFKWRGV